MAKSVGNSKDYDCHGNTIANFYQVTLFLANILFVT